MRDGQTDLTKTQRGDLITKIQRELRGERSRLEGDLAAVRRAQQALDPRTKPRRKRQPRKLALTTQESAE